MLRKAVRNRQDDGMISESGVCATRSRRVDRSRATRRGRGKGVSYWTSGLVRYGTWAWEGCVGVEDVGMYSVILFCMWKYFRGIQMGKQSP